MRALTIACCAVLGGALLVGCDDSSKTSSEPTAPKDNASTVDNLKDAAKDAANTAKETAEQAATAAKDAASEAASSVKDAAVEAKDSASQAVDSAKSAVADSEIVKNAQQKLQQAMEYVNNHKLDLAQNALDEVDKVKDKLPATLQAQLANVHAALDKAKSLVAPDAASK